MKRSQKGMAVVLVMLIVALMTAIVVEFASATYTANAAFYNWTCGQRLSLAARSGLTVTAKLLSDKYAAYSYTYPGIMESPVPNILKDFEGQVIIRIEDENAKFNLNSLVLSNNILDSNAYAAMQRLLKHLNLDESIADKIADWIDTDSEARLPNSENGAKNAYLDNIEELYLIIDAESCKKLLPFVTVYGTGQININTASTTVLMTLDENMTEEMAKRIENYRALEPFKYTSDIVKVAGFEGSLGQSLMGMIIVKASDFRITSTASENQVKRVIECVVEANGQSFVIKYWQET